MPTGRRLSCRIFRLAVLLAGGLIASDAIAAPLVQFDAGTTVTPSMPPPTAEAPATPRLPPPALTPTPDAPDSTANQKPDDGVPPATAWPSPQDQSAGAGVAAPGAEPGFPAEGASQSPVRFGGGTLSAKILLLAGLTGGVVVTLSILGLVFWWTRRRPGGRNPMAALWGRVEARALGARDFVEVDEVDPQNTLTTHAILQRGWTPELMEQVLGRPDFAVLDPQRKRQPLKLYDRARVEQAEQGKQFLTHQTQFDAEQERSEARIRKWVELRRTETGETDPPSRGTNPRGTDRDVTALRGRGSPV